jgi:hypothetical protein
VCQQETDGLLRGELLTVRPKDGLTLINSLVGPKRPLRDRLGPRIAGGSAVFCTKVLKPLVQSTALEASYTVDQRNRSTPKRLPLSGEIENGCPAQLIRRALRLSGSSQQIPTYRKVGQGEEWNMQRSSVPLYS